MARYSQYTTIGIKSRSVETNHTQWFVSNTLLMIANDFVKKNVCTQTSKTSTLMSILICLLASIKFNYAKRRDKIHFIRPCQYVLEIGSSAHSSLLSGRVVIHKLEAFPNSSPSAEECWILASKSVFSWDSRTHGSCTCKSGGVQDWLVVIIGSELEGFRLTRAPAMSLSIISRLLLDTGSSSNPRSLGLSSPIDATRGTNVKTEL